MSRFLERWFGTPERREKLYGINRRNVALVRRENPRRHYPLADDKLLAKSVLTHGGVRVPETLAVCEGLFAIPDVLDRLIPLGDFVVKPSRGSGGDGIVIVRERVGPGVWLRAGGGEIGLAELRKQLADIVFGSYSAQLEDRAFVEPRIEPHPALRALWPDGLCDVRVLTLRGTPFMAMLRVPTRRSRGRANLHSGGLGLAVNVESGRTTGGLSGRTPITRHPDSGESVVGIQVPAWQDVLLQAVRAARSVPLGYLGVDLVIDETGAALVLEINARPGLEIQNVHALGLGDALPAPALAVQAGA